MTKEDDFVIGDKVRVFQLTTTDVGDCGHEIFVGNVGTYCGWKGSSHRNDCVVEFESRPCLVSSCDLEVV